MNDNEKTMRETEHAAEKEDKTMLDDNELSGVVGGFNGCDNGGKNTAEEVGFLFNVGDYVEIRGDFFGTNRGVITAREVKQTTSSEYAFYPVYHIHYVDLWGVDGSVFQGQIEKP